LALYDPERECVVDTDANQYATGGVIYQRQDDGLLHPVVYESRVMSDSERSYSTHDQELLAIILMLRKHRTMLLNNKPLTVVTDHMTLRQIRTQKRVNHVQSGWLETLAEYPSLNIVYHPGRSHTAADGLSCKWDDDVELELIGKEITCEQFFHDAKVIGRIEYADRLDLPLPEVDVDDDLPDHDIRVNVNRMPPMVAACCMLTAAAAIPSFDARLPSSHDFLHDRMLGNVTMSQHSPAYVAFISHRPLPDHDFVLVDQAIANDEVVGESFEPIFPDSGPPSPIVGAGYDGMGAASLEGYPHSKE